MKRCVRQWIMLGSRRPHTQHSGVLNALYAARLCCWLQAPIRRQRILRTRFRPRQLQWCWSRRRYNHIPNVDQAITHRYLLQVKKLFSMTKDMLIEASADKRPSSAKTNSQAGNSQLKRCTLSRICLTKAADIDFVCSSLAQLIHRRPRRVSMQPPLPNRSAAPALCSRGALRTRWPASMAAANTATARSRPRSRGRPKRMVDMRAAMTAAAAGRR